ncbi:MAG: hypothetical protein ABW125_06990, partial [Candidatus Thiodiazotropha lotti]
MTIIDSASNRKTDPAPLLSGINTFHLLKAVQHLILGVEVMALPDNQRFIICARQTQTDLYGAYSNPIWWGMAPPYHRFQ